MSENKEKGYYILTKNVDASQPYHFVLKAPNHETILSSENYTTEQVARNGIESVRKNGPNEEQFEIRTSKADEPYFVLKGTNGKIIGTSQMYSGISACEHGIKAVMKYAALASLHDNAGGSGNESRPIITNHPTRSESNKYA
jgi:hypothetical protein